MSTPIKIKIFDSKEKFHHNDKSVYYVETEKYQITPLLKELYSTHKTEISDGSYVPLHSHVRPLLGYMLYRIILDNNLSNVLEIGTGFGVSALYMLEGLYQNKSLNKNFTTIDPCQNKGYKKLDCGSWNGGGLKNIYKSGHSNLVNFMEEPSYLALPKLLQSQKTYDLVFYDGNKLFDYITNDILLIDQITKIGSVIVILKALNSTEQFIKYVKTNYKHWQTIKNSFTDNSYAIIYVKMDNDTRNWNYDIDF